MAKFFSLFCISIMAISTAGCEQDRYAYIATFFNACTYPVQVTVSHYSNLKSLDNSTNGLVKPGEFFSTDPVLQMIEYAEQDIQDTIANNYKLEISANGRTISLDKAGFLKVLEDAKLDHPAFTTLYGWTINDSKLCP